LAAGSTARGAGDRRLVVVMGGQRLPEATDRLAESATGLGEALGPEHDQRDHQDDDQVHGAEQAVDHGGSSS